MAVGRALRLNICKYGSWDEWDLGTGIAPLPTTQLPTTPGTPLPPQYMPYVARAVSQTQNSAVGLISVDQLSLVSRFSGFLGMTEVYNLSDVGIPNDH